LRRRLGLLVIVVTTLVGTIGAAPARAAFPGTNGRIVFGAIRVGSGRSQIYSVRPDGSGLQQLTHVPTGSSAWKPHVSADGERVVFVVSTQNQSDQLWLMRWDGTHQRPLTAERRFSPATNGTAGFTPNGRRIVYSRCGNYVGFYYTCKIVSVRRDGTDMRVVVAGRWHPKEPVVSPDGSTIAYVSDKGGYDARLWIVDADGTDRRAINADFRFIEGLSWSPDGSRIAFGGINVKRRLKVYTIAADGTDLQPVMPAATFPAWSPNGDWLIYLSEGRGRFERARPDGTDVSAVVDPSVLTVIDISDWGVTR
jgi:Tol biopolymer transport system component